MGNSARNGDPSKLHSLGHWTSFSAIFALGVTLILIIDALLHGSTAHMAQVIGSATGAGLIWYLAFRCRLKFPKTASFIRFFAPILLYGIMYGEIHAMITAARPSEIYLLDEKLLAIDTLLFGVNPIAWLGNIYHPLLTDFLYLTYFSYYFGMPVLLILMWRSSDEADFRKVLSAVIIGWYGALLTYTIFPALGPNRWMADQLPQLIGWLPTSGWIQGFLDMNLTPDVRDCIPSMHTGVTLLTLIYSYKYQRTYFRMFLIFGLGIIAATMYIQAHYVIDVLLGFIAAGTIYFFTERVKPQ